MYPKKKRRGRWFLYAIVGYFVLKSCGHDPLHALHAVRQRISPPPTATPRAIAAPPQPPEVAPERIAQEPETSEPAPQYPTDDTPPETAPSQDAPIDNPAPPVMLASTLPLKLPAPPVRPPFSDPRIAPILAKNARFPTFAAYRKLSEIYIQGGAYEQAVKVLRVQAGLYRRKGLLDAALIQEKLAARYNTQVQLFADRKPTTADINALNSGARLEPVIGCYLGAFIDRDDNLRNTYMDENWQTHRRTEEFAHLAGKRLASAFMYLSYGNKFPGKWLRACKEQGVIPHIAWEPQDLRKVQDDNYLRDFGRQLKALDWPVFIRFASEMNGDWTPYHGNPPLYRQTFRRLHAVLHREAPKVATIWCVNNPPLNNADDYYPGDDGCDWVGVNFYAVPFYENKRDKPAFLDSPLSLLDPIYKRYAARKPIAICEFGASHRAGLDRVLRPDFAIDKMSQLYSALPLLYPRVKLVDWFNMDTIRYPSPGKTANSYTLTDVPEVLQTYRQLVSPPYFLSTVQRLSDELPSLPRPIRTNQSVRGPGTLQIWAKTYVARPRVYVQFGSKIIFAANRPGAQRVSLNWNQVPSGSQLLTVYLYDDRNTFISKIQTRVTVAP